MLTSSESGPVVNSVVMATLINQYTCVVVVVATNQEGDCESLPATCDSCGFVEDRRGAVSCHPEIDPPDRFPGGARRSSPQD